MGLAGEPLDRIRRGEQSFDVIAGRLKEKRVQVGGALAEPLVEKRLGGLLDRRQ